MTEKTESLNLSNNKKPYLNSMGAWALAFGCSVGWGSFVMPGSTFLPIAGPIGTALGLGLGGLVMLIIALNYHYLMNKFPDGGGTYTYTKKCFGYDHGFLGAWFLILTYIAIIWANSTALPLIARAVFGDTFRFGFLYEIAGYKIYAGEILLAVGALVTAAVICLFRNSAQWVQIVMALLLIIGVIICFTVAIMRGNASATFSPAFVPGENPLAGTFTIFALAPWAYVGFESISHSAAEAKFSLKKSFIIMAIALIVASIAYILLSLLSVTSLPEGCSSWTDYIFNLGKYSGSAAQPSFFAVESVMGKWGFAVLGAAALGAIFTGLIGNFIALSRLIFTLSDDRMFPAWFKKTNKSGVPQNAVVFIMLVSAAFPFLGRTAISWIVDVTTVGATIAYALACASAFKAAKGDNNTLYKASGIIGLIISVLFAIEFLIPNLISVKTLSTESYLILSVWSIFGFLYFRLFLPRDKERRLGHSIVAWVVLLGLIFFTSTVWMRQTTDTALNRSIDNVQSEFSNSSGEEADSEYISSYMHEQIHSVTGTMNKTNMIQITLIAFSILILLDIYSILHKRERQIEIEKALAEESSRAKTSFLSNMSHEIRTPMNAIIGLDNIALRDPDISPRTREHLEKIGASAKHLLGLINDILDMSRIESGRMVLKNEEFSFSEFLEQINIIINGQCQDKGLHYECNIVGNVKDYYYGDDMKLKQVLINILGNSVKFTNTPGSVTLTIEQLSVSDELCTLCFRMADTGIGMDKEYIPKIFETFSQEDSTTTNNYGGSGLGMAITKNFVEMMGGKIEVESEKGVGSTFIVTVNLKPSERSAEFAENSFLPEGIRAVIIDDDEIACEHTQLALMAIGIESDTFTDSRKAYEAIKKAIEKGEGYTLMLTDYKMPDINGLELTRMVHGIDNGETSVIMLTGYNWDIIEDEAKMDGVDGILAKPLFSDTLMREISRVLGSRLGLAEAPEEHKMDESEVESVLAGRRVLMAEDVEQNAEILEDLLMLEDIEAEHAVNGEIALKMFSDSEPGYYDAILMDVRMPVMDGLSATQAIRALERDDAKTIPIIAMTANVFDEDVERSLQSGMNAHLSKPIEPERLYSTLAELICSRTAD